MRKEIAQRRAQIVEGARICFAQYGYEGATVCRLERSVALSRGAIFHYFPDKDAVFLAVAQRDTQNFAKMVRAEGVCAALHTLAQHSDAHSLRIWAQVQLEIMRRVRTDPRFAHEWSERVLGEDASLTLQILYDGVLQQIAHGADADECIAVVESLIQ